MKLRTLLIIAFLTVTIQNLGAAQLNFTGNSSQVINVAAPAQSGLNAIYVAENTSGLTIEYVASSASETVTWSRYSSLGGAYAQPLDNIKQNGAKWTLEKPEGNMGYMIETSTGNKLYFWLVDYDTHRFEARSLELSSSDCTLAEMAFEGNADKITYYSITGRAMDLDRDLRISYTTSVWDDDAGRFVDTTAEETRAYLSKHFNIQAPLATTSVTLEGDRFLRQWKRSVQITSASFPPVAIELHANVEQHRRDSDNEQGNGESSELGGSAPVDITFKASVTEAAIFTEWQMARDEEFDLIDYRTNELEFDYTFLEMGTTYVRFVAANADASCESASDVYTIFVGESALVCPNAFSPGTTEGVNDIWKVSYKSIVKFECYIFNKWGTKLAEFTDPSQGWDGKYNGKYVPAGVYYYVIKAVGADGRKYDKSGDINIVGYR